MTVIVLVSALEVHHVDEERRGDQQNALVQRGVGREQDREGVRAGELLVTPFAFSYQLTRPRVPSSLDVTLRAGAIIHHIVHDSSRYTGQPTVLVTGTAGTEAELARLQTAAIDVHALMTVLVGDGEHVVAAVENVLHQTAALLVGVQNVHLGRVQAEDYDSLPLSRATLAGERAMHLDQQRAVRTAEVHVEGTVGAAGLALAAVALLEGLHVRREGRTHVEEGHLVLVNLAVIVGEENGVLSGGVVLGEDLPEVDVLHNAHTVD